MKRIFLFLATNLAVMLVLGVVISVFGLNRFLTPYGIDYSALLVFSLVVGFTGSIISLLMSKRMAKWTMGLTMISQPRNADVVALGYCKLLALRARDFNLLLQQDAGLKARIEQVAQERLHRA